MHDESSGATDATEETVPSKGAEQLTEKQTLSFAQQLLASADNEGHDIGEAEVPKAPEHEPDTEPEDETTPPEGYDVTPPEAAEKEPTLSIDEQIAAHRAKGEKPPWYLVRISEESAKRRERTEALERAQSEAQQLRAQLAQASAPRPTASNPFADIYDEPGLQKLEAQYEKVLEFAEKNRDGAEGVLIGTAKDGAEIRRDLTPDEVAEMRYKADKALRKDLPLRRAFLSQRYDQDRKAIEAYPDLAKADTDLCQNVVGTLQRIPQLESVVGPDVAIWIADAFAGRAARLSKNGNGSNGKTPSTASVIAKSAQTRIAPTKTSRSIPERKGTDLAAAKKRLEDEGTQEAADAYLEAKWASRSSGGAKPVASSIAD